MQHVQEDSARTGRRIYYNFSCDKSRNVPRLARAPVPTSPHKRSSLCRRTKRYDRAHTHRNFTRGDAEQTWLLYDPGPLP